MRVGEVWESGGGENVIQYLNDNLKKEKIG